MAGGSVRPVRGRAGRRSPPTQHPPVAVEDRQVLVHQVDDAGGRGEVAGFRQPLARFGKAEGVGETRQDADRGQPLMAPALRCARTGSRRIKGVAGAADRGSWRGVGHVSRRALCDKSTGPTSGLMGANILVTPQKGRLVPGAAPRHAALQSRAPSSDQLRAWPRGGYYKRTVRNARPLDDDLGASSTANR